MTMTSPTDKEFVGHEEDFARSEIYSLLAHLFFAPPTPALLAQLRGAHGADPGTDLAPSWNALTACARELGDSAIQSEYDALFGGVGKPDVYLFGSHYLAGFLNEKPLVRLRDDLAALGLARDPLMSDTEDHIAYLCEVMRYLISNPDTETSNLMEQRDFYSTHIRPWADDLCMAILRQPAARFYACTAALFHDFSRIESQSFDMLS